MPTSPTEGTSEGFEDSRQIWVGTLPGLKKRTQRALRSTRDFTLGAAGVYKAILPFSDLLNRKQHISEEELHEVFEGLFDALAQHPVMAQLRGLTNEMRSMNLLPNEQSTEVLIRSVMNRFTALSSQVIPTEITDEFWNFFNELSSEPELNGLGEVSIDIARIIVSTYEPLMVKIINQLKDLRETNDDKMRQVLNNVYVIREDLVIYKRQIKALRHIRTFFSLADDDYRAQAEIVAQMVREFGPFFIKIAQVAASNSDFLPEEMSEALSVFQEDVEPMTPEEVAQAFQESFGEKPEKRYYGFDASEPLKSGSIASVYSVYKPLSDEGREKTLVPVLLKVGRHNLEREFLIGKTVIKLFILTSQYWAPHSKLAPFLKSWLDQTDVFVEGFRKELDFEAEANNQSRFGRRAAYSRGWQVPDVYESTRRVIEMELIEDSQSLNKAFEGLSKRKSRQVRRKIARSYLHAVLSHMLINKEFHGDLHQGNVLVQRQKNLYFIDWGNTVDLRDIWKPSASYIKAVLVGDVRAIVDSVITMSAEPDKTRAMRSELIRIVAKTFDDAGVKPLGYSFAITLIKEGQAGLKKRLDLLMALVSNLSRKGISVQADYLHLGRSFTAMVGSFLSLYNGLSKTDLAQDIIQVCMYFPSLAGATYLLGSQKEIVKVLKPGAALDDLAFN